MIAIAVGWKHAARTSLAVLGVVLLAASSVAAQSTDRWSGPQDPGAPNLPSQRLGVNDLLSIAVLNSPEFTRTIRVSSLGDIRLPMLKQPVKVEGFLPAEVEARITQALKTENLLVNPVVSVTVAEYASRPITIVGAVRRPLTFQAVGPVTLLEALSRAEGLVSGVAGPEVLVTRRERSEYGDSTMVTRRIPTKALVEGADPQFNLTLYGGEEIRVPELGKVFVIGNVRKPGAFPVPDGGRPTVLQLVALSEGLLPYSTREAYIHRGGSAPNQVITLDIKQILDRKAPDVPLVPNDILYIPADERRKTSATLLLKVVGFVAGTLSGVLIYSAVK